MMITGLLSSVLAVLVIIFLSGTHHFSLIPCPVVMLFSNVSTLSVVVD